jgi:hypothetical protein
MPPSDIGPQLTPEQIAKFRAWIEQGAEYTPHWAFQTPKRPAVPANSTNPIDSFVAAKPATAGLKPSPEADRTTLIRRVTLDLTGLLPTPQEVADFIADRDRHRDDTQRATTTRSGPSADASPRPLRPNGTVRRTSQRNSPDRAPCGCI